MLLAFSLAQKKTSPGGEEGTIEKTASALEQADKSHEGGGPCYAVSYEQMLTSLIHRPFHLSQAQMKWDRSFLLTAAAQPCVLPVESLDPPISPPFNCHGGKQRNFDFIITLGLLCSTVGNLNGIIISGDNGQGRGRAFYLRLEQKAA